MKMLSGWWMPDHEQHLGDWMNHPKNKLIINGRQSYQGKKQLAALEYCKLRRVACDIGGHAGTWSFNLAHEFGAVHAFEPVAAHRECFVANVQATNVTLHACALGDHEAMINIRTEPTSSGDSRVDGPGDIPMHTLDSFTLQEVDLMKLDTEGFELNVLRGAEQTIARCKPVIVVEQKPGHAVRYGMGDTDAVPWLQARGYRVAKEMSGDFICVPA